LNTVVHLLSQEGHFKTERIDAKKSKVDTQGSKFKRPNVTQQKEARQKPMPALTGLIAFSKLVQARNMLDLEEELLFRGVHIDAIPKSVSNRKKTLQDSETQRLTEGGMDEDQAAEQGKQHFKKQSNAAFDLGD